MICPICKKGETSVVDSRPAEDGTAIRRRRLCTCSGRFTTFERVQFRELMVIKKNGRKASFDRDKLAKSVYIALKKRPIDTETVEKFISKISRSLEELGHAEISSNTIKKGPSGPFIVDQFLAGVAAKEAVAELSTASASISAVIAESVQPRWPWPVL